MEVANILDIDGSQWEIQDVEARNDIAAIKQLFTVEKVQDINLTLNAGYSALESNIRDIQKYGKLYMGLLYIDNLAGQGIGTTITTNISKINISLKQNVYAIGIEYLSSKPVRVAIGSNGVISISESPGVTNGNNCFRVPITWIEA